MNTITPARLIESSCEINENLSQSSLDGKSTATCLLNLTIEEPVSNSGEEAKTQRYVLDLPPETLTTLLGGLTRIREQLSNVARI